MRCPELLTRLRLSLAAVSAASLLLLALPLHAQSGAADRAWKDLEDASRAAQATKVRRIKVAAENDVEAQSFKKEREQRAKNFRSTADRARDFYEQHPAHPRASDARKIEALSLLEGITPTDRAFRDRALAVVTAFRNDASQSLSARVAIAHAVEAREVSRKTLGRPWYAHPVLGEMLVDQLEQEFGNIPEVQALCLALARQTDCDSGRDVALRIVQSPTSTAVKASATRILERYALVRQPLDFPLQTSEGRATSLAALAGQRTVVCIWDGKRFPAGQPGLADYVKHPPADTTWVYISIGELGRVVGKTKPPSAPPGTICVEAQGWQSPLATKLKLSELPYAFVLDERKQLSGYGRIDEISALLAGIGRPVLP